jgi:hypothetical protein
MAYDAGQRLLVGTDPDTFTHRRQGEVRKRRSAIAVVADRCAELVLKECPRR